MGDSERASDPPKKWQFQKGHDPRRYTSKQVSASHKKRKKRAARFDPAMVPTLKPSGLVTEQMRRIAQSLTLGDKTELPRLKRECKSGKINPLVFRDLLYYGYGKPPDHVKMEGQVRMPVTIQFSTPAPVDPFLEDEEAEAASLEGAPQLRGLQALPPKRS